MESDTEFLDYMEYWTKSVLGKEARARLFALARRGAEAGWRPIETAPKDGTHVLIYNGHWHITAWEANQWRPIHTYNSLVMGATHWMPLPAPPQAPESNHTPDWPTGYCHAVNGNCLWFDCPLRSPGGPQPESTKDCPYYRRPPHPVRQSQ